MNNPKIEERIAIRILGATAAWNGWHFEEPSRYKICRQLAKSIMETIERESMRDKHPERPAHSRSDELVKGHEKIKCQNCDGAGYTQKPITGGYVNTRCEWCNGFGHYFREKPEPDLSTNRARLSKLKEGES